MTKDQVILIREQFKDKIIKITLDNQHIFYDNTDAKYPIIWDDDNELFIVIRPNQDAYVQYEAPFEVNISGYDHIQQMTTVTTATDILTNYIDKMQLNENGRKYVIDLTSKINGNKLPDNLKFPTKY